MPELTSPPALSQTLDPGPGSAQRARPNPSRPDGLTSPAAGPGTFGGQLGLPAVVLDVRPPPARPGRGPVTTSTATATDATATGTGGLVPSVLLLSRSCDGELDAVAALLSQVGVAAARLNADELAGADLVIDASRGTVRLNGRWLRPTVIWNRHFTVLAIEVTDAPARDLFRRDSWRAAAGQLATLGGTLIGGSRPGLLEQLALARRLRIAVPHTVVTTAPGRAAQDLPGASVVVKALSGHFVEAAPGRLTGVFPVVTHRRELARGSPSGPPLGAPVVVQEYVEHDRELRVYYADGELHGFAIRKGAPADPWLSPENVEVRRAEVPPAVAAAARRLATALGLRYGAFDFLLRAGEPVFLEVNADGDWRWIESRIGAAPVTLAVTRMVCDLHREAVRAASGPAGPNQRPFDLVAFLSARPRRVVVLRGRSNTSGADAGACHGAE
jgi:hypothetical protein